MDYVTIRIWTDTRRLLRLIAAQTNEQMVQVMHRLCEDEWRKIAPSGEIAHDIAQSERRSSEERDEEPQ